MINSDLFLLLVVWYLGVSGVFNIIGAIMQLEKTVRPKYGVVEGIVGLLMLAFAFFLVVI